MRKRRRSKEMRRKRGPKRRQSESSDKLGRGMHWRCPVASIFRQQQMDQGNVSGRWMREGKITAVKGLRLKTGEERICARCIQRGLECRLHEER